MTEATRKTPQQLLQRLENLKISTTTVDHAPVFTVEEARAVRVQTSGEGSGAHCKNLFLRNKKGRMWLVVCPESLVLDLRELGNKIGAGRLSFGSVERLNTFLGVEPGSVTPFGIVHDTDQKVEVVIAESLMREESLNFHPLVNSQTTNITVSGLLRFLEAERHHPTVLPL